MKGDKQLKQERGYRGKSFVRPDGSECLLDKLDWDMRKRELWKRAGGRCEYDRVVTAVLGCGTVSVAAGWGRCTKEGVYPCHVNPRHPVRDDRLSNLKLYCKQHDAMMEKQSWRKPRFGEKTKPVQKRRHAHDA